MVVVVKTYTIILERSYRKKNILLLKFAHTERSQMFPILSRKKIIVQTFTNCTRIRAVCSPNARPYNFWNLLTYVHFQGSKINSPYDGKSGIAPILERSGKQHRYEKFRFTVTFYFAPLLETTSLFFCFF